MGFRCGIVGLPNVGKSTLFNALTNTAAAEAANYPFSTIEPNLGRVAVPDDRLAAVAEVVRSPEIVPTQLAFVDIAGLVAGANTGEGLGNQFLAQIREVDAIAHVLRCFDGGDVVHVAGRVDPIADAEIVETELMLADLASLERRQEAAIKRARGGDADAKTVLEVIDKAIGALGAGRPARSLALDAAERAPFDQLQLLTAKPMLYVANVDEDSAAAGNAFSRAVADRAERAGGETVVISAAIEAEVAQLANEAERREFLDALGLAETGLVRLIGAGYRLLGLITFFTAGPKQARAWTLPEGSRAVEAAAAIHTDFARGFIRAETIAWDQLVAIGGEQAARDAGIMRQEGRDYRVRDGDVILFRFNV
ncbi:MAG: redox-regulated ATPase YchF [Alphaproteobacteria bacterium]|jgi:hypothetical protein|nr:redox-regulated ATPase YchF [Alphaproteobacteria bacterium]MDP6516943.1 redox-regulated ATPase YchF [Alphaproteobacteria bacterium]